MGEYEPHEMKIIRRGVSIDKVIASYKHFGSLRKAAAVCGISKDTVKAVILRWKVPRANASLPAKASYNPKNLYSPFAKWHKVHANDSDLPHSTGEIAKLAGVKPNVVKCYFQRRRDQARKILAALPDLRRIDVTLDDIEGNTFSSKLLIRYRYAIELYAARAALQGEHMLLGEVTVLISSIDQFASRVKKLTSSASQEKQNHQ